MFYLHVYKNICKPIPNVKQFTYLCGVITDINLHF